MTNAKSWGGKLLNALLSLVLVMGLLPVMSPAKAYAEDSEQYGFLSELEVGFVNSSWLLDFDPEVHEYSVFVPRTENQTFVMATLSADAPSGSSVKLVYENIYNPGNYETRKISPGMYVTFSLEESSDCDFIVRVGTTDNAQDYVVHIKRCDAPIISVDRQELSLAIGETAQLSTVFPDDFPYAQSAGWSSDDHSIATVDGNGVVRGVSAGTTSVYSVYGSIKATPCTVTVADPVPAPGYLSGLSVRISNCDQDLVSSFDPATRSYRVTVPASESSLRIRATASEDAPDGCGITLKYVNALGNETTRPLGSGSEASVGVLSKGAAGGSFSVLVGSDGDAQEYVVEVERCEAPVIALAESEVTVPIGGTYQLSASFQDGYPLAAAGVQWSCRAQGIQIDENGLLTALASVDGEPIEPDTYTVTAKHGSASAKLTVTTYSCLAEVVASEVPENLKVGDTFTVNVAATADQLAAMEATLSYDDSKLKLVGVAKGAGLSEGASFVPADNEAEAFFTFCANEADASEGIVVATATFQVLVAGDDMAITLADGALMAKQGNASEIAVTVGEPAKVSAMAAALLGDANGNGKVNIVDAQIVYDMSTNAYGDDYAAYPLPQGWNKATLLWVANVNGDDKIDAVDAFAIQHFVHYQSWK